MNHRVRMQRFVARTLDIRGNRGSKQSLPPAFLPSHAVTLLNVDLARGSHGGPFRDPQFLLIADI